MGPRRAGAVRAVGTIRIPAALRELLNRGRARLPSTVRRRQRGRRELSVMTVSASAYVSPRRRRRPAPNGMNAWSVSSYEVSRRSGRNVSGAGKYAGS
ncbi:hypothetical protein GCM10027091_48370 [Streptomyces daliensis]